MTFTRDISTDRTLLSGQVTYTNDPGMFQQGPITLSFLSYSQVQLVQANVNVVCVGRGEDVNGC